MCPMDPMDPHTGVMLPEGTCHNYHTSPTTTQQATLILVLDFVTKFIRESFIFMLLLYLQQPEVLGNPDNKTNKQDAEYSGTNSKAFDLSEK